MGQIFFNREKLVLASGSPRRRKYFEDLGLSFSVHPPDIEESQQPGELSQAYVKRLAEEKARAAAVGKEDAWIVAADTVIQFRDMILEKPVDKEDARRMLMLLSGTDHLVQTGVCLFNKGSGICEVILVSSQVFFWKFSADTARAYVESGEPMDKAGSYGIQGKGAFLVRRITGSYSNIVGLPLCETVELLLRHGVICNCETRGK
jgi:septum formation protein